MVSTHTNTGGSMDAVIKKWISKEDRYVEFDINEHMDPKTGERFVSVMSDDIKDGPWSGCISDKRDPSDGEVFEFADMLANRAMREYRPNRLV